MRRCFCPLVVSHRYALLLWVCLLHLAIASPAARAELFLFDDDVANGAAFWHESAYGLAELSSGSDPIAVGTHSFVIEASNWSQAGLSINMTPPQGQSILEARIYRPSGNGGSLVFRYGSSWTAITLSSTNSDKWTLDGQPGFTTFTNDAWHTIKIDLAAFGLDTTNIKTIGIKGSSSLTTWFMDEVVFKTPTPPPYVLFDDNLQNGANFWHESSYGSSGLSSGPDPVATGSYSMYIEASNWSQAGLSINQTPPDGKNILQAMIYRPTGSGGSLIFRYGSSWTAVILSSTNSDKWTLDGQPGYTTFTNDTWHQIQINLAAFGLETTNIKTIGIKGSSSLTTWFMDDIAFVASGEPAPIEPPIAGNWTLTLEDDFDGNTLNPDVWRVGQHWLGINGVAGNDVENIEVANGNLVMTAEKRTVQFGTGSYNYATGEISTFQKFRQTYGYYEARIKYDSAQGVWPAFWLMPDRGSYGYANNRRQTFIKFDLSSTNQTISSAVLRLKISAANSSSNVSIHPTLTESWTQSTINWTNKPKFDPEWFGQFTGKVTGDWIEVDVTYYVQAQRSAGKAASFALVDTFMKQQLIDIFSNEATDPANRPRLVVNTINVSPSDDAYVNDGTVASTNYGSNGLLKVMDPWGDTSSTFNGGMEFDIMESLGIWGDDVTAHALHWDGYGSSHQSTGSGELNLTPSSDGYHTYGVYWEPGYVAMFVDGVQTWTWTNTRVGSIMSYVILSLQMGGWDGNGNIIDNQLPAKMYVDYVRVWSGTAD